jgi:DNA-binding response OmpR family regulator
VLSVSNLERGIDVVFIVDDDEMITKSLGLILKREGFDVFGFTNPLRALERMETVGPDLLISDVMMPQLSGVDLAVQTRIVRPDCKILLFSAAASDLMRQLRADGHDFRMLQKPVHPDHLLHEIDKLDGDADRPIRPAVRTPFPCIYDDHDADEPFPEASA